MSTSVNPSAEPSPVPVSVAPGPGRKAAPEGPRKLWWFIAVAVIVAVGFTAAYYLRSKQTAAKKSALVSPVRTAKVTAGTLYRTVRISGSTSAARFANIAAPLLRGPDTGRSLTLVSLAPAGTMVKKGQVVAQIDTTATRDHIDDVKAIVATAEGDIRKRRADQAIEEETLRQNLREIKANLDKARLDNSAAEVRTAVDQEQLKLLVEQYEMEYREAQKNYEIALQSNRSEIRLLEMTLDRHKRHLQRHVTDEERFTIRTPIDGLVVMLSLHRGGDQGQVQEGDTVSPNQTFMRIVDPQSMQMDGVVNQVESEWLRIGQPARARFDAFPGLSLRARVHSMGALAVGGWRQNYYIRNVAVKVQLLEQHPQVIPDLSCSADVLVEQKENALIVPLEAVHQVKGKTVVRVRERDRFVAREVELGLRNNTHAAVLRGVEAGQVVALGEPPAGMTLAKATP